MTHRRWNGYNRVLHGRKRIPITRKSQHELLLVHCTSAEDCENQMMRSKRLYTQAWLQRPKTSGHSRVVVLTCKCRANFVRKDRKELKSTRDLPENIDVDMGSSKSKDQQVRKETKEKWKMENHRDGLLNFGGSDRGGGISTRKTTSLLVLPHFPPLSAAGYDGSWAYWKPERGSSIYVQAYIIDAVGRFYHAPHRILEFTFYPTMPAEYVLTNDAPPPLPGIVGSLQSPFIVTLS